MDRLPPTFGTLLHHAKRACLQAGLIWAQCLIANLEYPDFEDWRWKKEDGVWTPLWSTKKLLRFVYEGYLTMQDVEETINDIEITTIEKNSDHWVDITHIINPHQFYIRLTKHRDAVKRIQKIRPVMKPLSVGVQDIVIFNLKRESEEPKYARGKVTHVEQTHETRKCSLFALDYGYSKKNVPLDEIWECDNSIMSISPLALSCRLANCAPRGGDWGQAIQAFKDYVGTERAKMIVEDVTPNGLVVTLYNTCPDDIATLLALTDFTTLGATAHNSINKMQATRVSKPVSCYNFKKFETGEVLHVRVLSGKSLDAFYVADVNDYRKYLKEREYFTQISKREAPFDETSIKCGDIVFVNDMQDKIFKRGVIKEVDYNKCNQALVHLVDLGKDKVLSFGNLRRLPKQYLSVPVVGIFCTVEDTQAWSNHHILLHPGRELLISVTKLGHEFELANIVKIIKIVL